MTTKSWLRELSLESRSGGTERSRDGLISLECFIIRNEKGKEGERKKRGRKRDTKDRGRKEICLVSLPRISKLTLA